MPSLEEIAKSIFSPKAFELLQTECKENNLNLRQAIEREIIYFLHHPENFINTGKANRDILKNLGIVDERLFISASQLDKYGSSGISAINLINYRLISADDFYNYPEYMPD